MYDFCYVWWNSRCNKSIFMEFLCDCVLHTQLFYSFMIWKLLIHSFGNTSSNQIMILRYKSRWRYGISKRLDRLNDLSNCYENIQNICFMGTLRCFLKAMVPWYIKMIFILTKTKFCNKCKNPIELEKCDQIWFHFLT